MGDLLEWLLVGSPQVTEIHTYSLEGIPSHALIHAGYCPKLLNMFIGQVHIPQPHGSRTGVAFTHGDVLILESINPLSSNPNSQLIQTLSDLKCRPTAQ